MADMRLIMGQTHELLFRIQAKKRILVLGPNAAGKSTLARLIAEILAIPCHHLDDHFWKPNWEKPTQQEWDEIVLRIADKNTWVIEGDYLSTIQTRVARADLVIWLRPPRHIYMRRFLARTFGSLGKQHPHLAKGCRGRFSIKHIVHAYGYYDRCTERIERSTQGCNRLVLDNFHLPTLEEQVHFSSQSKNS